MLRGGLTGFMFQGNIGRALDNRLKQPFGGRRQQRMRLDRQDPHCQQSQMAWLLLHAKLVKTKWRSGWKMSRSVLSLGWWNIPASRRETRHCPQRLVSG